MTSRGRGSRLISVRFRIRGLDPWPSEKGGDQCAWIWFHPGSRDSLSGGIYRQALVALVTCSTPTNRRICRDASRHPFRSMKRDLDSFLRDECGAVPLQCGKFPFSAYTFHRKATKGEICPP
jgi:hypothetical protein